MPVMARKWILLLFPLALLAQHHPAAPPEKPVALLAGLGTWRHSIATKNAEAQKFFDQGLTLLYGFNRYEAMRSFRKAAALDASAVMPLWGVAMATGPHVNMDFEGDVNLKTSCEAAQAGMRIAGAPARERLYIEAVAARCPEFKPDAYIAAMRALAMRYPDDLDASTLFAESLMVATRWRWYQPDGQPAPGVAEAERTLEAVLRRVPDHAGANHLYIHAVESSRTPERAVPSAQRLMGIVPAAGHLVHMPGHIWLTTGDYEMAAAVNERAAEMDRQYFGTTGVTTSSYTGYYVHNLHFVAYARQMQGRSADALAAADAVANAVTPMIDAMPQMVDTFAAMPTFARVRFGKWDEILAAPRPHPKLGASNLMWHYARVLALTAKTKLDDARGEQAAFEELREKIPAEAQWANSKMTEVAAMVSAILEAKVAHSAAASVPHWQRAVEMQDRLAYDEPPAWYYPVRESMGGALLRAGKADEAEAVFREGVRRSPRNGRMLFGLWESLKAQKKMDAAASVEREFRAAWERADVSLTVEGL
jgi:tetratricopeptide (TPR) repeat protein